MKKKTVGKMTKSRGTFGALTGVTQVVKDKSKYTRKVKHKGGKASE